MFEARDRVGGRLHSQPVGEAGLDLGATWFWPGEERVIQLNAELGLATHAQHLAGDAMFQNSTNQATGAEQLSGNPLDVPSGRWTAGAQALTNALHAAVPTGTVSLADPVTAIEFGDAAQPATVTVTAASGSVVGSRVVLALPPALAVASIEFAPALDPVLLELAQVTPVWMGATAKVIAHYNEPFWRSEGRSGSAFSHDGPMRELHDMSGPGGHPAAIFGFAPSGGTEPISHDAILEQLVALFGPAAAEPMDLIVQDWSRETWTSPGDVADHTNYQTFGHPVYAQPMLDGRLFWTSTETSPIAPGHVEGALAAAERTAAFII